MLLSESDGLGKQAGSELFTDGPHHGDRLSISLDDNFGAFSYAGHHLSKIIGRFRLRDMDHVLGHVEIIHGSYHKLWLVSEAKRQVLGESELALQRNIDLPGSETPKYIAPETGTDIAGDDAELLNCVLRHDNGNFVSGRELLQS